MSEYRLAQVGDIVYVGGIYTGLRKCVVVAVFAKEYENFPQWNKLVVKPMSGWFRGEFIVEQGQVALAGEEVLT